MILSETRKAIRAFKDGDDGDAYTISRADLKELEAACGRFERVLQCELLRYAVTGDWVNQERLLKLIGAGTREDPERVELASAPSGGELSGR